MSKKNKCRVIESEEACCEDSQCVLKVLNDHFTNKDTMEIVAVGDYQGTDNMGFDAPTRVGLIQRKGRRKDYATGLLNYGRDGKLSMVFGHYDMTLLEAWRDMKKRNTEEKKMSKILWKKGLLNELPKGTIL